MIATEHQFRSKRFCLAVILGWLATLGVDFFLHGGLFKDFYLTSSAFLLPLDIAFKRIPLGYISFLIATGYLAWLIFRINVTDFYHGFLVGLLFGVAIWGSLLLGLYSITTIDAELAIAWFVGQSFELGVSGGLIGWVSAARSYRGPATITVLIVVLGLTGGVVLQNI